MKVKPSMVLIMLGAFLVVASIALPVSLTTNFMTITTITPNGYFTLNGVRIQEAPLSSGYKQGELIQSPNSELNFAFVSADQTTSYII